MELANEFDLKSAVLDRPRGNLTQSTMRFGRENVTSQINTYLKILISPWKKMGEIDHAMLKMNVWGNQARFDPSHHSGSYYTYGNVERLGMIGLNFWVTYLPTATLNYLTYGNGFCSAQLQPVQYVTDSFLNRFPHADVSLPSYCLKINYSMILSQQQQQPTMLRQRST